MVEELLDAKGEEIIYVGDHMYTDIAYQSEFLAGELVLLLEKWSKKYKRYLQKKR